MFEMIGVWVILGLVTLYVYPKLWIWLPLCFLSLFIGLALGLGVAAFIVLLIIILLVSNCLWLPTLRRQFVTHYVYKRLKGSLPAISDTERTALETGHSWLEESVLQGKVDFKHLSSMTLPQLDDKELAFINNQTRQFINTLDDWKICHQDKDLSKKSWEFLRKNRFFGLEISPEYGGLGFGQRAHSEIINLIAQHSLTAAVTVMVPNSLGPAELLAKYGTDQQKSHYLPKLAKGEHIPCFGLTAAHSGSDATSMVDFGVVCHKTIQGKKTLGISLTFDKRYITLAPVATLIGLAFKLHDPDHLLSDQENLGITICLLERGTPGLKIGDRHLPLDIPFMNGPISGKDVFVPIDAIIGGPTMAGQGWKMLMECLSVGRSISLPSLSSACGRLSTLSVGAYARIREQFNLPIGYFEGIEEKLSRICGYSYIIEATALLTLTAVSQHKRPSVASAIAKYHTTELSRKIVNDAMDVLAGKGIILGPMNHMARAYQSIPVSITVEGANIMTRNLIIFGQGVTQGHPFLLREIESLNKPDEYYAKVAFDLNFMRHLGYLGQNFIRSLVAALTCGLSVRGHGALKSHMRRIQRLSLLLSWCTDVALVTLKGGLKRKERTSARLGDMMSYLYMALCCIRYYEHENQQHDSLPIAQWALDDLIYKAQEAFYDFCDNLRPRYLGILIKRLGFPYGRSYQKPKDHKDHQLSRLIIESSAYRKRRAQEIYFDPKNILGTDLIEQAFQAVCQAKPIYDKLKQAYKDKQLDRSWPFDQQLEQALSLQLITPQEKKVILDCEAKRARAIAVDQFDKL